MKNIQIIDGAINCSYSVYQVSDRDFAIIFPGRGQDIEFIEDLNRRVGAKRIGKLVLRSTARRMDKGEIIGIHGTLFFQLIHKKQWYPNKRESDLLNNRSLALSRPSAET